MHHAAVYDRYLEPARLSRTIGRWIPWLGFVAIGTTYLYLCADYWRLFGAFVIDDTYIYLRYAHNAARGLGLVYNAGEANPAEGYTSFLWAIWLIVPFALKTDPVIFARASGVGFGLITLFLTWRFTLVFFQLLDRAFNNHAAAHAPKSTHYELLALLAPALLALNRTYCVWAVQGLETKLFGTLLILAFWGSATHWFERSSDSPRRTQLKSAVGGLVLAMLVLSRPEGYLFAAVLCGTELLRIATGQTTISRVIPAFVTFLSLVLSHLAFRWTLYRDVVPNTFHIKATQLEFDRGLDYLGAFIEHGHVDNYSLLAIIGSGALICTIKFHRSILPLACVASMAGYVGYLVSIGGDWFSFRFFDAILPLWAAFVSIGLYSATENLHRLGKAIPIALQLVLAALVLIWTYGGIAAGPPPLRNMTTPESEIDHTRHFARAGRWLAKNIPTNEKIAIRPAGIIAYLFDGPVLDVLGLNDQRIAKDPSLYCDGPPGHRRCVSATYLRDRRATYYVGYPNIASQPAPGPFNISVEIEPGQFLIFQTLSASSHWKPGTYGLTEHHGSLAGFHPADVARWLSP